VANVGIPAPPQNQDEGAPLSGLYLDRPPHKVDPKGFSACNNVRIEMGRVRSDLMGWQLSNFPPTLGVPIIYQSAFIDSNNNQIPIFVTATDILIQNGTQWKYITPAYNSGFATVTNGSAAITGFKTRWASDIQYGDTLTVTATFTPGVTKIYVTTPYLADYGISIVDQNNLGAIPPGTYVLFYGQDGGPGGGNFIILSQATIATVTAGDTLFAGTGGSLRPNVRAGDQISFGDPRDGNPASTWYTVQSVNSDTSITLTVPYAGATAVNGNYRVRQLLTNTVTGAGIAPAAPYLPCCSSTNFPAASGFSLGPAYGEVNFPSGADEWFFTNGIDPIVVFYGGGYSTFFSRSIPFKCATLIQKQGLLICGGLLTSGGVRLGSSIASSDNGFPQQMSGGVSFQGIATDGPFNITRLGILGSSVMIYQTGKWGGGPDQADDISGAVTSASFVGFPTIWAFSDVIKTRGPLSGGAVAVFPDRHQFLAIDGEYRYNGLFIQVMNDQVWRQVLKTFDTSRPGSCFATVIPTFGDLIWAIPQTTDPLGQLFASTAWVEHYMEQANSYLFKPITQRDFPFFTAGAVAQPFGTTWASFGSATWNQLTTPWNSFAYGSMPLAYTACDASGNVWSLYQSNKQNGVPRTSFVTWGARVIGNGRARALVTRVYPEIEVVAPGPAPVTVTMGLQDAVGGPTLVTDTQTFDATYAGPRFTTHYRRGRVATVTFSDTVGLGWVCDGYDFDWITGGLR